MQASDVVCAKRHSMLQELPVHWHIELPPQEAESEIWLQAVAHTPRETSHMQSALAMQPADVVTTAHELAQLDEAEFHIHCVSLLQPLLLPYCWQPAPHV